MAAFPCRGKEVYEMADLRRYQIHCPECGCEFIWDHDPLDHELVILAKKQKELFGMINAMQTNNPPTVLAHSDEFKDIKKKCGEMKFIIGELKAIKHANHGITGELFMAEFKEAFRDKYGDEAFYQLVEETQERLKPKRIDNLMKERPKG